MKNTILSLLMVTCSTAFAQINKAEIIATGLTCSMCSNAIYKQLLRIPAIEKVETNLNTNTFTVYTKNENQLKPNELKENVEKSGFFIGSLIVYLPSDSLKIQDMKTLIQGATLYEFITDAAKINLVQTKVKLYDKGYVTAREFKKNNTKSSSSWAIGSSPLEVYHVKRMQ